MGEMHCAPSWERKIGAEAIVRTRRPTPGVFPASALKADTAISGQQPEKSGDKRLQRFA